MTEEDREIFELKEAEELFLATTRPAPNLPPEKWSTAALDRIKKRYIEPRRKHGMKEKQHRQETTEIHPYRYAPQTSYNFSKDGRKLRRRHTQDVI